MGNVIKDRDCAALYVLMLKILFIQGMYCSLEIHFLKLFGCNLQFDYDMLHYKSESD